MTTEKNKQATCLSRIISLLPSLNPVERKVGEYVKAHADACLTLPIGSLAKKAGCSPGTITRFVSSLGYTNYKEFTIELAKDLAYRPTETAEEFSDDDTLADTVNKVFQLQAASLHDTRQLLDMDVVEEVVECLTEAQSICVFGCGESGAVALYAQTRFENIGIRVHAYRDSYEQLTVSAALGKNDVAVGISYSGLTRPVNDALAVARKVGATTVALTNSAESPITKHSDYVILTAHEERKMRSVSYTSYFALLCLVDLLYLLSVKSTARTRSGFWDEIEQAIRKYYFKIS